MGEAAARDLGYPLSRGGLFDHCRKVGAKSGLTILMVTLLGTSVTRVSFSKNFSLIGLCLKLCPMDLLNVEQGCKVNRCYSLRCSLNLALCSR